LAVNLRYPSMGEASLSQLVIWEHALPALVTRVGWYATLPEDTAAFIRHEQELEDIKLQLSSFLREPERFASMGHRGFEVLCRDHAPDRYADSLIQLGQTLPYWSLRATNLIMAKRVGRDMQRWITPDSAELLTEKVADAVWELGGRT